MTILSTGPAGEAARRAPPALDFDAARRAMVDNQIRTFDVTDPAVLDAFYRVPREVFVPQEAASFAYSDRHLAIGARRLVAPLALARMIQSLGVRAGESALSVACGSGYSLAILARLGARAEGLESDAGAAEQGARALAALGIEAPIRAGALDGSRPAGEPEGPLYDVILVNGACAVEPMTLLGRLAEGGRLVCGLGQANAVFLYVRTGEARGRRVFDAGLPQLPEFAERERFVF